MAHLGERSPASCCAKVRFIVAAASVAALMIARAGLPDRRRVGAAGHAAARRSRGQRSASPHSPPLVGMTIAILCWIAPGTQPRPRPGSMPRCGAAGRTFCLRRIQPSGPAAARRRGNCGRRRRPGVHRPALSKRHAVSVNSISGFRAENLLAVDLDPPAELERCGQRDAVDRFLRPRHLGAIETIPGVESVGAAYGRPLKGPIGLDSSWRHRWSAGRTRPNAIHGSTSRRSRQVTSGRWARPLREGRVRRRSRSRYDAGRRRGERKPGAVGVAGTAGGWQASVGCRSRRMVDRGRRRGGHAVPRVEDRAVRCLCVVPTVAVLGRRRDGESRIVRPRSRRYATACARSTRRV